MKSKPLLAAASILALLFLAVGDACFVELAGANPIHDMWAYSGEVPPDLNTNPPVISIFSPENDSTYGAAIVSLSLNVSVGNSTTASSRVLEEIYYKADWQPNNIYVYQYIWDSSIYPNAPPRKTEFSTTVNLTGLQPSPRFQPERIPEGKHIVVVYAVERGTYESHRGPGVNILSSTIYFNGFNITSSSVVSFIIDTTPPSISGLSVKNKAYSISDVPLNFTVDESVTQISYVMDGQENVTIGGNTTLSGLTDGTHNVTVYAKDAAGNIGASKTVYFSVRVLFPATLVATASAASVAIAVVGVGIMVYFRKRNH